MLEEDARFHRLSNISEGETSTGAENSLVIEFLVALEQGVGGVGGVGHFGSELLLVHFQEVGHTDSVVGILVAFLENKHLRVNPFVSVPWPQPQPWVFSNKSPVLLPLWSGLLLGKGLEEDDEAGNPEAGEEGVVDEVEHCDLQPGQGGSGEDGAIVGVKEHVLESLPSSPVPANRLDGSPSQGLIGVRHPDCLSLLRSLVEVNQAIKA